MARIPITTLNAENPENSDAIPKNTKLSPIMMDTNPVLIIGKIMKINPNIIDNIPAILFDSMLSPPKNYFFHFFK